jgi:hypothetical protein
MAMTGFYLPNTPTVASEVIDAEAVIMNLQSGQYYSASASGGFIWRCIELGQPTEHIAELLGQRYQIDHALASTTLNGFLNLLNDAGLVRAGDIPQEVLDLDAIEGYCGLAQFTPPALNTFSDMQDLLLLDPIHDVDAAGWPSAQAWPQASDDKTGVTRLG